MSRVFNQCPDCSVDLPSGAMKCACGWRKRVSKAERPRREPIPCAHDGCAHDSILSLKLRTGWANLCRGHYEHHIQLAADKFNREHGLDTREKQRAFIMEKLGAMRARGLPVTVRVPGEDDEERAA